MAFRDQEIAEIQYKLNELQTRINRNSVSNGAGNMNDFSRTFTNGQDGFNQHEDLNPPPIIRSRIFQVPGIMQHSSGRCPICGYTHGSDSSGRSKRQCPCSPVEKGGGDADRKSDGGGDGKKPDDDACKDGKGNGGGGGGDAGSGADGGGKGGAGGTGGGDAGGGGRGGNMNGDDPRICPGLVTDYMFVALIVIVVVSLGTAFACRGHESVADCLSSAGTSSCPVNENMMTFFNKAGVARGGLPPHLRAKYREFKQAMKNANCLRADPREKCGGLVNYADTMAGATIISTGKTQIVKNPILCKCKDKKLLNQLCNPKEGTCKNCVCDTIEVDTILRDDGPLRPGYCWAFSGTGEVDIGLFFPIVVIGVTIRHPAHSILPPGFFSSAPKDFELWGIDNKDLHSFGKFEYTADGGSTQIFEVQNPSMQKFSQVKFNFTSNHGNPNYTAVYKVELHGLLDNT